MHNIDDEKRLLSNSNQIFHLLCYKKSGFIVFSRQHSTCNGGHAVLKSHFIYRTACIILTPFLKSISLASSRFFFKRCPYSCLVCIQEWFVIKSGLWWRAYNSTMYLVRFNLKRISREIIKSQSTNNATS